MRIGVAATPDVAIPTLNWLEQSQYELVRVISQPDRPSGRGQNIKTTAISDWALAHLVELHRPVNNEDLIEALDGLDLLITIGYGRLLPKQALETPRLGCINLHFSLLPKYRGAAPVQRAIENGEIQSGVTVFKLDEGMDTGPIYVSQAVEIDPTFRSSELLEELSNVGAAAISKALTDIENDIAPIQQSGLSSLAKKLSKEEGEIDWNASSTSIVNKIRAFFPQPSAWTVFRNQPLKISNARQIQGDYGLEPGQLLVQDSLCLIGASDGNISLISVVPAGKKEMSALDWSRGARFTEREYCG